MSGGTIAAILHRDFVITLDVRDELTGESCLLRISPTNYRLSIGDYISWDGSHAWWRSQHVPEKEVMLFRVGVTLKSKSK